MDGRADALLQGIAVHPEMTYAALRSLDDGEGILLVARERINALSEVLGHFEDLGNVQGIVSRST
jgi:hypothetical protein